MLGKLLKYEFKSTSRFFVPLYGLLLAVSLGNRIISSLRLNVPRNLLAIAYIMLFMGLAVITFIQGITRFKNNLLGDEGYLMFTLPVSRLDLVMSKLIGATVWSIVGITVALTSVFILAPSDFFMSFVDMLSTLIKNSYFNGTMFLVYMTVLGVLSVASVYSPIYLALALGHMYGKNKMLASFGWYFAINFLWQTLCTVFISITSKLDYIWDMFVNIRLSGDSVVHVVFLTLIACGLLYNAIHIAITTHILTKKLNLE